MQQDSLAAKLHALIQEKQLSQKDVATAAGISQSTVSRALKGDLKRRGEAKKKLFIYMQQQSQVEIANKGRAKVISAFDAIWDQTEAQADAVADIIKACGKLTPTKNPGGND